MNKIDPDEVFHRVNNAGKEWVNLNAQAKLLEDCEKSELSQLVQEYLAKGASSNAEAEHKARADDRTKDYIKRKTEARRAADEAKVLYEAAKTWWEATRTLAATLRQESRMLS
jgi:hypothetical protein